MTVSKAAESEDLRELLNFPQIGAPEYLTDSAIQRRIGNFLAEASTRGYFEKIHGRNIHGIARATMHRL